MLVRGPLRTLMHFCPRQIFAKHQHQTEGRKHVDEDGGAEAEHERSLDLWGSFDASKVRHERTIVVPSSGIAMPGFTGHEGGNGNSPLDLVAQEGPARPRSAHAVRVLTRLFGLQPVSNRDE